MKIVKALPKMVFDDNFSNEKFKYYDYACFISIIDKDNFENKYDHTIENFLQVKMWDIEDDIYSDGKLLYDKPENTELEKVVNFINKHIDKKDFIIHCSAGISRSGAVATFIYEKFNTEIDKELFRRENKYINPNLFILKRLKEIDNGITS